MSDEAYACYQSTSGTERELNEVETLKVWRGSMERELPALLTLCFEF